MASLGNCRIHDSLSSEAKRFILSECWDIVLTPAQWQSQEATFDHYFAHYQSLCSNRPSNEIGGAEHCIIVKAVQLAKLYGFEDCLSNLDLFIRSEKKCPGYIVHQEEFVRQCLLFAVNALLLVDGNEWERHGRSYNQTLRDFFIDSHFTVSTQDDAYSIPPTFNLRNLERIGGMNVRWTGLLSEHLQLEKHGRQIAVFQQTAILDVLEKSDLYPPGLLKEVLWTFDILLPRWNNDSRRWFRSHIDNSEKRAMGSCAVLDPTVQNTKALSQAERNISVANFYRDRLISIKDEYDAHGPRTILQYFIDDRDPARRWRLLIAGLVFFFGMVQAIEGAIQCYKAYHPA